MSASAPQPPDAPSRPSRFRRLARFALVLALVGLGSLALALVFLHTPMGRDTVKGLLENNVIAAIGGQLRIGSLRYRLWQGSLDASALRLTLQGVAAETAEAHLRWTPRGGLRLSLERPSLVVRDTGQTVHLMPASGLAARPWLGVERFAHVEVAAGRVELRDRNGAPYLVLDRVAATMQERQGSRAIRIEVRNGLVAPPGGHARLPFSGTADLHLAGNDLVIDALRLVSSDSTADLRGVLSRLGPGQGTATMNVDVDAALFDLVSPGSRLSGRVRGQADLQLRGSLSGRLRASSPALSVRGVGPWDASLRGLFDPHRLVVERAEAFGYGGRFTASGDVAFDEATTTDLALRAQDVDAATLVRAAAGDELPVRSRLQASLRWTTKGIDIERGRGAGNVTLEALAAPKPRPDGTPGLPLTGTAKLLVEGRDVRLAELRLEARGWQVAGDLGLSPAGDLRGHYRTELALESVPALAADLGASASLPAFVGRLVAEGEIGGKLEEPFATVQLRGEGISTAAAARAGTVALAGGGRAAAGRLTLESLVARSSGGGQALVAGGVPLTAAGGDWDLHAEIDALDLAPLLVAFGISGQGSLDGRARVSGPFSQPTARADLDTRLRFAGSGEPIEATFSAESAGASIVVERFAATLAGGSVKGDGSFDRRSHAIEARLRAEGMRLSKLPLPAALRGLDGTLAADLSLAGTTDAPAGELHGSLSQAVFGEGPLPGLALSARADGQRLDLVGASTDPARSGAESVFLRGHGPLGGDGTLHLQLDVAALPLQAVLDAIPAARRQGAAVDAQGVLTVDVPLRRPRDLRYASDRFVASGRVSDVEWQTEPFRFDGAVDEAVVSGLRLTATSSSPASPPPETGRTGGPASERDASGNARAGGTLAVEGRIAIAPSRSFDLAIEGALDLATLQRLTDSRLAGAARARLRVRGTAAEPDLLGQVALEDGRGRIGPVRLSGVQLLGRLQGAQAVVERLEAGALGGRLTASGAVPLRRLPPGAPARLHFEAADLDLSRLLRSSAQGDPDAPSFVVSLVGDLEASAPELGAVRGAGRFTRVEQQSTEGRVALQAPAEWTLEHGRFTQAPLRLAGPLGTLEARGEARLADGAFAGTAVVAGPFDLRLVGPFLPDTALAGPTRIDLRASWDQKGVRLEGGLTVENGRLTLETLAFTASGLKGEVRLLGDRATVQATASSGDGPLVLSGGMTFGPRLLGPARLRLDAQRVLISYPEGFRARASGVIRLSGQPGAYRIGGDVDLTHAYYTADFDQKGASLDRLEQQLQALQGGESIAERLPLAVRVKFSEPLRIRNARAQLDVVGEFTAQGTLASPSATGQVSLLEGGRVQIRRGDLRVQEGRVELNGYPAGNPELDLTGSARIAGIEMDVRARGTFENLALDISSPNRPDLSQTDLVSLLLTGRTEQTAAAQSTTIVAEELAAALGGVVRKGLGELLLIDVGPDRSLITDDLDPTQRFSVGARLRQDLIVLYSTRLDGTAQRWILEWNPGGGRLRLRALDDQAEGLAVEVADRLSFDLFRKRQAAAKLPSERMKLRALRLEGTTPIPPDELLRATRLRIGRGYRSLRLERSADQVRERLAEQGWLSASVDAEFASAPGEGRSVELTLRVDAGPRVLVTWTGDRVREEIQARTLAAWPAYASPESAAAVLSRTAQILLQADRYYLAKVTHELRPHADEIELLLRVERGPQGRRVVLDFEGNAALDAAALRAVLPKAGSREFFESLVGRGGRFTTALRVAYARVGQLRTRIRRPRSAYDPETGVLRVVVPVRERGTALVSSLSLPQELVDAGGEAPRLRLRAGAPFDLDHYVADRDAIAAWYRDAGWMDARVRGVLEPSADALNVSFEVEPGGRVRARRILIEGDGRSKPAMVRRAVAVEPGAIVRPQQLAESRARLSELGVFRSVDVRPLSAREMARGARVTPEAPPEAPPHATPSVTPRERLSDVVVSYVERPDVTLEYGLRYSSSGSVGVGDAPASPANGRLQIASGLEFSNPLGWGWHFRPSALLTRDRHTFALALESATLFGLRLRTQLLVSDDDDNRGTASTFASRIRGVSVQQTRTLLEDASPERRHDRLRVQWGYADKAIQYLDPADVDATRSGKRSYFTLSLVGDERDSLTDPHRGLFWTASSELARKAFGSDVDYLRLYGQLFVYLPLPGRLVWAQGYRAGAAPGANPDLLLENRFQAGGPNTVRGYGQNALGPQTQDGIALGGQGIVVLNQELRFPIWRFIAGGVFWDAGNVWPTARDVSLADLRQSVGVGLRVTFPFGPVRVEYAWNVGPNRDRRRGRVVFALGHAF